MHIFKVLYKQTCQNVDHIIEYCNLTLTGYFLLILFILLLLSFSKHLGGLK